MTKPLVPQKKLPSDVTSYDLLKTFAVVIMVVDHIGAYFYPDVLWWRAVGRIGFPVWFFLIGYARGRDLPAKLTVSAGILLAGSIAVGMPVFPLNALVTIGLIRVSIDKVMAIGLKSKLRLWSLSIVLLVLVPPSYLLTEYGTQALITAMFGYFVRHRKDINDDKLVIQYMVFALLTFVIVQQFIFGFSPEQFTFMVCGTAAVRVLLYYFDSRSFPRLTKFSPKPLICFTQVCGRRTLEIYVAHLMLFKLLALWLGIDGFNLFEFQWVEIE